MSTAEEKIALSNCALEQVHIPGRIQSYGYMLSVEGEALSVRHASANLDGLLNTDPRDCLGRPLRDVLPNSALRHAVRGAMSLPTIASQRERVGVFEIGDRLLDAAVCAHPEGHILELEPVIDAGGRPAPAVARLQQMLAEIPTEADLVKLLGAACRALRQLSGVDRVMAYRFFESGDGEVIAEVKAPHLEPFLGLRYPAADIPPQVRALMVRMPFRLIADVADPHTKLLSAKGAPDLDLTLTHARGVSPIHVEYLTNMGVRASMNVAIVVRGALWGMFALHHYQTKLIDADSRSTCELFARLMSFNIQQVVERDLMTRRRRVESVLDAVRETDAKDFETILEQQGADLLEILSANGMAIRVAGRTFTYGETPDEDCIATLCEVAGRDTLTIDALGAVERVADYDCGDVSGFLCTPLSVSARSWLLFFRPEIQTELRWAGPPQKEIDFGPNGPRLTPRESFAEYKEQVEGRCHPWLQADTTAALEIRARLLQLTFDQSGHALEDYKRDLSKQNLVIAELNHRVKNILSLVRSVAGQSRKGAASLTDYVNAFEKRLAALATAHDLVGANAMQGVSIRDLLRIELSPFQQNDGRVSTSGPDVIIRAEAIPTLSLIFHELVANAVKYGALSGDDNSLELRWGLQAGGLAMRWEERLAQPLEPSDRRGFGLSLIQRAVPHEFGGTCELELERDGLNVRFWFPGKLLGKTKRARPQPAITADEKSATPSEPAGGSVKPRDDYLLLVEDHAIIAMELEDMLAALGRDKIVSCSDVASARAAIANGKPYAAILDVHLGKETSLPVASELATRGVPVIFLTGYDRTIDLPPELDDTPWLTKPVDRAALERLLDEFTE